MSRSQHVYEAHQHIRSLGLFTIILGLFATLNSACATPLDESLAASENKIRSRMVDMSQLVESLSGGDRPIALEIALEAKWYLSKVEHIRDLRLIESQVQNEADKTKIELIISSRIKALVDDVDPAVNVINKSTAVLHSNAALLIASKLKDDLRELKELLVR